MNTEMIASDSTLKNSAMRALQNVMIADADNCPLANKLRETGKPAGPLA